MSSQKGNVSRSRGQKHQNRTAYKNDRHGATVEVKKAKLKVHEGICLRCKEVLEWRVKYSKYKSLTQPRKCVKCSQKTVKDAYYVICKPCSLQLELCAKCGKKEDIVIPINSQKNDEEEQDDDNIQKKKGQGQRKKGLDKLDSDDDDDLDLGNDDDEDFDEDNDDFGSDGGSKQTQSKASAVPDMSRLIVKD